MLLFACLSIITVESEMMLLFGCLSIMTLGAIMLYWYIESITERGEATRSILEKEIKTTEKRIQECDDSSELIYWNTHLKMLKNQIKKMS